MVRSFFEAGKVLDDKTIENLQAPGVLNVHTYYFAFVHMLLDILNTEPFCRASDDCYGNATT
jgi:hypothetical protein